ncbi:MAG: 23S rRNA (pseudouridine(1915)-N(3))-methyltransferase RlmH [Candidatus Saccharibacteria bacterium]|nr:23S rRNA (pseudouridine(1915)-N(3))-methyltransferase RlmH [Candidatus Saccharibacteria bacterium]
MQLHISSVSRRLQPAHGWRTRYFRNCRNCAVNIDSVACRVCTFFARSNLANLASPHDLAMVILLEAIYRGSTISAGQPYHK